MGTARDFRWLSRDALPDRFDLRRRGWRLRDVGDCPILALADWRDIPSDQHARTLLLGVETTAERARLLEFGLGDAVGAAIGLAELGQRLARVADQGVSLTLSLLHGRLALDLLARDGFSAGRPLGLHPREFALLWRLAQTPDQAVTPERLLAEVWRLRFRPETNSLAVHVCRLRAKLRIAGLGGLIETTPEGAYRLAADPVPPSGDPGLDASLRIGETRHGREPNHAPPV